MRNETIKETVVIKFAGDSGDGIQLAGTQFATNTARHGYDLATFPDFPAEIRAPQGTTAGVSGFQIHFGSVEIDTVGDICDVLVVMNAAALKTNLTNVNRDSIIIADSSGFDSKNLKLAAYSIDENPLASVRNQVKEIYEIDISGLTKKALEHIDIDAKEKDRCKNMFVLGLIYWLYERDMSDSIAYIESKFSKKPQIRDANIYVLKKGFDFGETTELFHTNYKVPRAELTSGNYRSISGNEATATALICAATKAKLPLFYASYPITPASDILHFLAANENTFYGSVFQAEDEIATACAAIGASYAGSLGVCGTSGPGMALKMESISLAIMTELPLVVIDVQRAGPSTGLPTKTEQSDLLQAVYGRNGEAPLVVLAPATASECFTITYSACKIALEYMTPVIVLSDGYLANGTEPWIYPTSANLESINHKQVSKYEGEAYLPYTRDENGVRDWMLPGTKGAEHRIGGLEKQDKTGNVSYDGNNHEFMVKTRANKIAQVAKSLPLQSIDYGSENAEIVIIGWGSTYGAIRTATKNLIDNGYSVAHVHLRSINPFPTNLKQVLQRSKHVVVPEINNGQLVQLLRSTFLIDAIPYNTLKGKPIHAADLIAFITNTF